MEAAFFDLDKTVLAKASMVAFGRRFYRAGLISRGTVARALYGQIVYMHLGASENKLEKIRSSVLAMTRGWEQARVSEIVTEALETVIEPIVYREALDLFEQHRAAGRLVLIVSASPAEIVRPLARYLGADGVIASQAAIDGFGRYTGEMELYAYGPMKAVAIKGLAEQRGIDLDASYAYSDSYTDLPMLEVVGHPVAVNPDRVLAKEARDRGWEIRKFAAPVRLRDRVPVPAPVPTAIAAGTVAASLLSTAAWWYLKRRSQVPATDTSKR